MEGTQPSRTSANDNEEETPIISPREDLKDRLRKARERRKRRSSGDVVPGGDATSTAIPETAMDEMRANQSSTPGAVALAAGGSEVEQGAQDVKTSLAKKRALFQQQRSQRKHRAEKLLAARQSGQGDPATSLKGLHDEQPCLFNEHNDDGDDDFGYENIGKNSAGLRVILVKPERSPAIPPTASASRCCGQNKATTAESTQDGEDESRISSHGLPTPVVIGGLDNKGLNAVWHYPHESEEARGRDLAREEASGIADGDEQGGGQARRRSGTERVRRRWVAARDSDESQRLLKGEEGLVVERIPGAAPRLMRRGAFQDRLLRDAVVAVSEHEEREAWWSLLKESSKESVKEEDGVDEVRDIYGERGVLQRHRTPKEAVEPIGRGPSQAADFFSAHGAPSILEDPLEPQPIRLEHPPADEKPPPPPYLEAEVRQPIAGIGPEARLAGLDERAELRIVVPRVAFHDHPLFVNEDRLSASLRTLFGRYRSSMESERESYLQGRLSASLSTLLKLRTHAKENVSAFSTMEDRGRLRVDSAEVTLITKTRRQMAEWLLRDALSTFGSILSERDEVSRLKRAMNTLWQEIEDERRESGARSTPTQLVARSIDRRGELPGGDLNTSPVSYKYGTLDEKLGKMGEEEELLLPSEEGIRKQRGSDLTHFEEHLDRLEDLTEWLQNVDATQAVRSETASDGADVASGLRRPAKTAAEDRRRRDARRKLREVVEQCRASIIASKAEASTSHYVLRLSNEGAVTADIDCGRLEKMRREQARTLRFRVSVFVNGSKVSTTRATPLEWPDFACSFNHLVRLRLVRRPRSVMISIYSCSGMPWWPDQEVASVWVPVPGDHQQDAGFRNASFSGPRYTHALAPRVQWSQFSSGKAMATSGPLAERRTCGSVLVGTEWATSRGGADDTWGGRGVIGQQGDESTPTLPVRGSEDTFDRLSLRDLFKALWTVDGRNKLRTKPLQGLRSIPSSSLGGDSVGIGDDASVSGGLAVGGVAGPIPEFVREPDFLRLLPQEMDVDPNDPRHGSILRLGGLLAALGLGRRDNTSDAVVGGGVPTVAGRDIADGRKLPAVMGDANDKEESSFFRAPQEQQVLVFAGRRQVAGGGGVSRSGKTTVGDGGGRGGFQTFAYNNYRRWKEPLRHTLIRLRVEKPALFGNRPIPFREEDIRRDETFMAILAQEAAARAHRYDDEERRGSWLLETDLDYELDEDKQRKRIAVDHGRMMAFVQRVRDSRTAQARRQALQRVAYASVVQEESVPKLYLNLRGNWWFLKPKRALRPKPAQRTAVTVQIDQIISARNVPVRASDETTALLSPSGVGRQKKKQQRQQIRGSPERLRGVAEDGDDSDSLLTDDEGLKEELVIRQKGRMSSFVEVRFQDSRKRTGVYEGLTPLWKESLGLPFNPPMGDFSPANLSQVRDLITISLFDEVEFDDRGNGGYLDDETSIRLERHFLGSAALPFQTVYRAGRVEGSLRLDVPTVNLGYDRIHGAAGGTTTDIGEVASIGMEEETFSRREVNEGVSLMGGPGDPASPAALVQKADRSTYIRVLATLDPIPIVMDEKRVAGTNQESPGLVEVGTRWMKRVREATKLPEGMLSVELFVPDMFGNDVLVTRYLCPQEPPAGFNTVSKCAHYVRLVPFLEDWQIFEGVDDMWCTSQQLLDILAGDHEEHAILLHNFILHLIMVKEQNSGVNRRSICRAGQRTEVYIVVGRALPEGSTVYVMIQELSQFGAPRTTTIWKPATGEGFDARDARCPLVDVASVISQDNVWACIHRNVRPCDLNLDLNDINTWAPFFSSTANPAPPQGYTSIQEDISYRPTQQSFVYEVEDLVREALKRDIRRWRSKRSHTAFNADVSNRLAELLPLLEKQALQGETKMGKEEHRRRIENTMRSRDLIGFPLQSAFIDVDNVVQMVKATGIHEMKHPEVQFALAVQAFAYPQNVISIWVYIASITPR